MIHRNTRECEKCGEEHWGNGRLCTDCSDKECRPLSQLRIDLHAEMRAQEGLRFDRLRISRRDQSV